MGTVRIDGLDPRVQANTQTKDEWDDIHAPSYYVIGPKDSGITYLPGITLAAALSGGGSSELAFSIENPFDADVIIRSVVLDIRTAGASSASLDVGLVNSSSETDTDIGSSISLAEAQIVPVVVGNWDSKWKAKDSTAGAWLTGKIKVDDASNLVGDVIIEALPLYTQG